MVKLGVKTSEFWLGLASLVVPPILNHVIPAVPKESIFIGIAYIICRSLVKIFSK